YEPTLRSFVNIVATPKGGSHLAGFEQALVKTLRKQVENHARRVKFNTRKEKIEKDDSLAGLTAVVSVRIDEPQFEGQTRGVRGAGPSRRGRATRGGRRRPSALATPRRAGARPPAPVGGSGGAARRARIPARMPKGAARRRTARESSPMPSRLAGCRWTYM